MTNYNKFAKTFSNSRKNLKWEEIDYFLSFLEGKKNLKILDIGCGNGRLLGELIKNKINISKYLGVDLSKGLLDEAKKIYQGFDFLNIDMLDLYKINEKYDIIFFIASFHHLKNIEDRLKVLKYVSEIISKNGKIFMTNWALNSDLNKNKYIESKISGTENKFGSVDYSIKIGNYKRFYHCFSMDELEYLFKILKFKVIENRLFKNEKNFISILKI